MMRKTDKYFDGNPNMKDTVEKILILQKLYDGEEGKDHPIDDVKKVEKEVEKEVKKNRTNNKRG